MQVVCAECMLCKEWVRRDASWFPGQADSTGRRVMPAASVLGVPLLAGAPLPVGVLVLSLQP